MHWLEALEQYLQIYIRSARPRVNVTSATVEDGPPPTQVHCEVIGGWAFEERGASRGNIALHLFPSAS